MVSVVVTCARDVADVVCRTQTDWPGAKMLGVVTKIAVQPMEYEPPATEMSTGMSRGAGTMVSEVTTVLGAALTGAKAKAGVVLKG
jgi:hypothetical protein